MLNPILVPPEPPPHNIEAEQAFLGGLLANNRVFERVGEMLRPEMFADPLHGRIFDICAGMINQGRVASAITLKTTLGGDPDLARVGGDLYLDRLVGAAATIINASDYALVIRELHVRRCLIDIADELRDMAQHLPAEMQAADAREAVEERLFTLGAGAEAGRGLVSISKAIDAAMASVEAVHKADGLLMGVSTGLLDLDHQLGGLHKGDLIVLAGRPSMGKSSMAETIALNVANRRRQPFPVAYFTLETSAEQLGRNMIARGSNLAVHKLHAGPVNHFEAAHAMEIGAEAKEFLGPKFFVDDTASITVASLRARAKRLYRRAGGLALVVVDYLQLLGSQASDRASRRFENRNLEVAQFSAGLKALAKELDVPVLVVSQLNRGPEQREDKRPNMADLRDSGSIEQDADVVMLLYREEYYLARGRHADDAEKLEAAKGMAEVNIAKHRRGPTSIVKLYFDGALLLFGDAMKADDIGLVF